VAYRAALRVARCPTSNEFGGFANVAEAQPPRRSGPPLKSLDCSVNIPATQLPESGGPTAP